jgi:hypothetical protein
MALFDNFSNPFEGMNIFGARLPDYLTGTPAQGETPAIPGLLNQAQQERLRNQSLLSGILGAGATYLAQPKNQNIGLGAIIGKSFLGGMQGAQGVYSSATENEMNKLKIAKELRDAELDRLKAIPTDVREFQFGLENPAYFARQEKLKTLAAPKTNINLNPNKALLDVDKGTIEGLVASTNSARSIANQTRTINSLIGSQPGSGAIKLTADLQNFLGVNTPTDNGSTSDLEFGAYRSSFPSLATSKEGRDIMVKIAEANATRNAKLSDWARKQYQAGTFSYEGLAAEDNRLGRAVSPEIEARVKQLTATSPGANNPNQGLFNQADEILNRAK